jgi:hypothetical protein
MIDSFRGDPVTVSPFPVVRALLMLRDSNEHAMLAILIIVLSRLTDPAVKSGRYGDPRILLAAELQWQPHGRRSGRKCRIRFPSKRKRGFGVEGIRPPGRRGAIFGPNDLCSGRHEGLG